MKQFLGKFSSQAYALLRIVAGFLFLCHGLQKVFGLFGGGGFGGLPPLMKAAGLIELVGGSLILIGLVTSWSAFVCSGEMAVAYFMNHQPGAALPIQNGGERAVLFCFIFLFLATMGDGTWSVGRALSRRSAPKSGNLTE